MLDGFYSEKDIDDERSKQAEDREKAVVFIEKLQNDGNSNEYLNKTLKIIDLLLSEEVF